jgi:hypothetical protein
VVSDIPSPPPPPPPQVDIGEKKIFQDHELEEESVVRNFRITASDGSSGSGYRGRDIGDGSLKWI